MEHSVEGFSSYPVHAALDNGGCPGSHTLQSWTDGQTDAALYEQRKSMEQRGGNNPYQFKQCPDSVTSLVGTGCMNPACRCASCHGDCTCDSPQLAEGFCGAEVLGMGLGKWVLLAVAAWIAYDYFKKMRK